MAHFQITIFMKEEGQLNWLGCLTTWGDIDSTSPAWLLLAAACKQRLNVHQVSPRAGCEIMAIEL